MDYETDNDWDPGVFSNRARFWVSYAAQGSYVDEEDILREPFYLLAMGWLFILPGCIGILGVAGIFILKRLRKKQ